MNETAFKPKSRHEKDTTIGLIFNLAPEGSLYIRFSTACKWSFALTRFAHLEIRSAGWGA